MVDILFINYLCLSTWGSIPLAIRGIGVWFSKIDNLRVLYFPFIFFVCVMNVITFLAFGIDKLYAVKGRRRIKESTLNLLAIMFGALGAVIGMKVFKHKISKPGFKILIPLFIILHAILVVYFSVLYFH